MYLTFKVHIEGIFKIQNGRRQMNGGFLKSGISNWNYYQYFVVDYDYDAQVFKIYFDLFTYNKIVIRYLKFHNMEVLCVP